MRATFVCAAVAAAAALLAAPSATAAVRIGRVDGSVEVHLPWPGLWRRIDGVPYGLREGDRVRLAPLSTARVELEDGSLLEFSAEAAFMFESDDGTRAAVRLDAGELEAKVRGLGNRFLEVRTPAALFRLRDDKARVRVRGREAGIEVVQGLARVVPQVGEELELREGFYVDVQAGKPAGAPVSAQDLWSLREKTPAQSGRAVRRERARREDAAPSVPSPKLPNAASEADLGPGGLGLESPAETPGPAPKAEPARGKAKAAKAKPERRGADVTPEGLLQGLGVDLGDADLGLPKPEALPKPAKPAAPETLGIESLGIKAPPPEPPRPRMKPAAKPAPPEEPEPAAPPKRPPPKKKPAKESIDLSPLL